MTVVFNTRSPWAAAAAANGQPASVTLIRAPLFPDVATREQAMAGVTPTDNSEHAPSGDGGFGGILDAAQIPVDAIDGMHAWLQNGPTDAGKARDDQADKAQVVAELRELWGPNYERNARAICAYMDRLPPEEARILSEARDPQTGRRYGSEAAHIQRLLPLALKPQPAGEGLLTIADLERYMRERPSLYRKDEAAQARLRQLYAEREAVKGRQ